MKRERGGSRGRAVLLTLSGLLLSWGCADFDKEEQGYCKRHPSVCPETAPDNPEAPESEPESEPGPFSQASSRGQHTLVLGSDGSVWAWGHNGTAQLGDGTTQNSSLPKKVAGLRGVKSVAAGYGHSLALQEGKVWSWGKTVSGGLQKTPRELPGLSGITHIAAGDDYSLALDPSGSVWAWGTDGAGLATDSPTAVEGLPRIKAIAVGGAHALALDVDGAVWAWGNNSKGQLGNGSLESRSVPVKVDTLPAIDFVAAGALHSLALDRTGKVWSWGDNDHGQLGDGSTAGPRTQPGPVPGLSAIKELAAGTSFSLALTQNNDVRAWGNNSAGQLGNEEIDDELSPVKTSFLTDAVSISAGHSHALAVLGNGCLFAWGSNKDDRLGIPGDVLFFAGFMPGLAAEIIPYPLPLSRACRQ
ncbi:RCC1 domain-containing protein [Stigmatella erecta]|uniref:Alpha-tubulin suppressor n=1 Tax=Stigmatella erecta TaxID=83460 RepID=A0A1I0FRN9_9BACT|nr:sialidase [Stigmatella erecta]SET60210.1 Alpha-tubulin suppressor [Stigmatella erecta]